MYFGTQKQIASGLEFISVLFKMIPHLKMRSEQNRLITVEATARITLTAEEEELLREYEPGSTSMEYSNVRLRSERRFSGFKGTPICSKDLGLEDDTSALELTDSRTLSKEAIERISAL